jgi:tetratricopeptide (TPR) repeat protein
VARRGARSLRSAGDQGPGHEPRVGQSGPPAPPEAWIDEGMVEESARPTATPRRPASKLPSDVAEELRASTGSANVERDARRLQDATRAYERERYPDARRLLERLARSAPDVAAVRELHGLTLYRMGRWRAAIAELQAAERLTGSSEQHPVLADCHRALGHFDEVERLWDELRRDGAPPPVVVEGRIVTAGAMADRGEVAEAIRLLEQGPVEVRKPKDHHLRLWYALAALHERAGNVPRARQLFGRVVEVAPDFADATERHRSLR